MSIFAANIEGFGSPVYSIAPESSTNARVSAILNEARHVFEWHAEGLWLTEYKDGFADLLAADFRAHPKLIRSVLDLNDRVFSMIAYRAVELINLQDATGPNPTFQRTA